MLVSCARERARLVSDKHTSNCHLLFVEVFLDVFCFKFLYEKVICTSEINDEKIKRRRRTRKSQLVVLCLYSIIWLYFTRENLVKSIDKRLWVWYIIKLQKINKNSIVLIELYYFFNVFYVE